MLSSVSGKKNVKFFSGATFNNRMITTDRIEKYMNSKMFVYPSRGSLTLQADVRITQNNKTDMVFDI